MTVEHVTAALLMVIIIILGLVSYMTFKTFEASREIDRTSQEIERTSQEIKQTMADWTLYETEK